jgi:hypothetical protein
MNQQIKKLWVDALRSGEYEQGQECLKREEESGAKHCCLGVLCELYEKEVGGLEITSVMAGGRKFYRFEGRNDFLPMKVAKWAGLTKGDPDVMPLADGRFTSVADLNDEGKSFLEIADVIEEVL